MRASVRTSAIFLCLVMLACAACHREMQEYAQEPDASPSPAVELSPPYPSPAPANFQGRQSPAWSDTAQYAEYEDNALHSVAKEPLSTFSLDVDTASYANVRRFLNQGRLPHPGAVRVEEMINYFPREPSDPPLRRLGNSPFSVDYEVAPSPWNPDRHLLSITLRADEIARNERPAANLVFLVDVSGSMGHEHRLPLAKASLKMLTDSLRSTDTISIVTYASGTAVVLEPTSGADKATIHAAIDNLRAGGATAGGQGLLLAYKQAELAMTRSKGRYGVNRILLCTDGDFNVGVSSTEELANLVKSKRDTGITISILGFGTNNLNDRLMSAIANNGNGNYSYVDTLSEARKVLGEEMEATLVTVANDVKAQIEFNPAEVVEYRQIGYEKRQLKHHEFNDDNVDAGDIGAGRQVTVLYELALKGAKPSVDPLRYQGEQAPARTSDFSGELAFVKLRWKRPGSAKSVMASLPVTRSNMARSYEVASPTFRFIAAVAAYGQKLRSNPHTAAVSWEDIARWGEEARGNDPGGYRAAFPKLARLAGGLQR